MDQPMNKKQYCDKWIEESELFRKKMVYQWLTNFTPDGNILELGCGSGQSTYQLLKKNQVLSLDNNDFLINEAEKLLKEQAQIHKCNFLELTQEDKNIIKDFAPKVVVGWFLGSDGEEVEKYTTEEVDITNKVKRYREKIEDIILTSDICTPSVEYIHLAFRSYISLDYNEQRIVEETKKDYEHFVFKQNNFEVDSIKIKTWPKTGSNFRYGSANNQNINYNNTDPAIVSLLAKRKT